HAELRGGDDREPHHRAGPALLGAGHDPAAAVRLDPDEGARRARHAEPPTRSDADRLVRTERRPLARAGDRLLERLERAFPLVELSRRTLVAVADEVATPELDGVEADARGEHVVVLLD